MLKLFPLAKMVSLFYLVVIPVSTVAKTPLPQIIEKLQTAWDASRTYQADFKQEVHSKTLNKKDHSSGTISVIKPGKLRWETPADKTTQILNGKKLISLRENRRRKTTVVDIYKDITQSMDMKSLNFLAGKAKFKESYDIEFIKEDTEKIELKLKPKGGAAESYIAEIDKKSYFLRALTTDSADSKVRIEFANAKFNLELKDSLFDYQPGPKDIVHQNP